MAHGASALRRRLRACLVLAAVLGAVACGTSEADLCGSYRAFNALLAPFPTAPVDEGRYWDAMQRLATAARGYGDDAVEADGEQLGAIAARRADTTVREVVVAEQHVTDICLAPS